MDHPMTIGANDCEIIQSRLLTWLQRVEWLGMVNLNETHSTLSVSCFKIKRATLAFKLVGYPQDFLLFLFDEFSVALSPAVHGGKDASLFGFNKFRVIVN